MTYRAHALRRAAVKRSAAGAARRAAEGTCGKWIEKCVEVGSHQPPCRCVLWKGHSSYCSSVPLLRADRIFV